MGQHASKPSNETTSTDTEVQVKTDTLSTLRSGLHLQALKRTSYIQTKEQSPTTQNPDAKPQHQQQQQQLLPSILHTPPQPSPLSNLRQRLFHLPYPPQLVLPLQRQRRHHRDLAYPRFDRTTAPRQRAQTRNRDEWLRAFQNEFDLVVVVDDSTSMLGEGGRRWREVQNALAGMVMSATGAGGGDGDGVDVYLVNHWSGNHPGDTGEGLGGYTHLTTASQVHAIFNKIRPCGRTPFGTRLGHLLLPYLDHVENASSSGLTGDSDAGAADANNPGRSQNTNATTVCRRGRLKPLYVVGITDGAFTDDAEEILLQTARRLQGCRRAVPWQISVQFVRVGDDEGARRCLEALEGALRRRARLEGITREVLVGSSGSSGSSGNRMGLGIGTRLTADGMVQRMMDGVQSVLVSSAGVQLKGKP